MTYLLACELDGEIKEVTLFGNKKKTLSMFYNQLDS